MYYTRATHLKKHKKGGKLRAKHQEPNFLTVFINRPLKKEKVQQQRRKQSQVLNKLRQKIGAMRLVRHLMETVNPRKAITQASSELGINPRTVRRWWATFQASGYDIQSLRERSRRPRRIYLRTHPLIEYFILLVRMLLGWGAQRIEAEFRERGISGLSHQTIHRIISRTATRPPVREKKKPNRYRRKSPNSLWHIDIKGPFWIKGVGKTYIIALVDDASSYIISAQIYPSRRMEHAIELLNSNITLWAKPLDLMSDNDTAFCHWAEGVINQFQKLLRDNGINHLRTRVNSPETNGKIERFWRTLEEELLSREIFASIREAQARLNAYVTNYNEHRLHKGIQYQTPASIYVGREFTDRGFDNIWGLEHLSNWLNENLNALTETVIIDQFRINGLEGALGHYPKLTYVG
jgi:transposase InsO family protein